MQSILESCMLMISHGAPTKQANKHTVLVSSFQTRSQRKMRNFDEDNADEQGKKIKRTSNCDFRERRITAEVISIDCEKSSRRTPHILRQPSDH